MAIKTPEQIAASGDELGQQGALIQALMLYLRPYDRDCEMIYHVPNGGYRGDARMAKIVGAQMTLAGVKRGVPDLHLPVPRRGFSGLYLEMKEPDGKGHLSADQIRWLGDLSTRGNCCCAVVDTWQQGYTLIAAYFDRATSEDHFRSIYNQHPDGAKFAIYDPSGYLARYAAKMNKKRK